LLRVIFRLTALVTGCLLAIGLCAAAHGAVDNQIHPFPSFSPHAVGAGFTPLCAGTDGIILLNGEYECMSGYGTYDISNAPQLEEVVSFVTGRIWVHTSTSSYCFTPSVAYASTYVSSFDFSGAVNVQLSNNFNYCAPNPHGDVCNENSFTYVAWNGPTFVQECMGAPPEALPTISQVAGIYSYWTGRIWFHQDANGNGWADCINPFTFYMVDPNSRDFNAGNVQSVNNSSPC
jgi:hypothetical protein